MDQFNLDSLMSSYDNYVEVKESLKRELTSDFALRKENAALILNGEIIEMSKGQVLLNLMLLDFFVERGIRIEREDIYLHDSVTTKYINNYMNHYLTRYGKSNKNNYDEFRHSVAETLNELSDIAYYLNVLAGNSLSLADFVEVIATDEDARHLFRPEIPRGLQFNEIEDLFHKLAKSLMNYFKSHRNLELNPYCISGTGINEKQFVQLAGFVGLKPDMHSGVIPVVNKDNFLYGLTSLENYYINCMGTRKALCTNYTYVRRSGYLTRKLSLACVDIEVNPDYTDCGTKHYVVYSVDNIKKLNAIIGRHYYDLDDGDGKINDELKTITPFSTELIGKKIGLRSPVTCKKDHGICATCYGKELAEKNRHINCGLNAVYLLTNPLTQRLLSAKHLLSTNTEKVDFGEDFNEAFTVNLDKIYFNELSDTIIEFDLPAADDYDEDMDTYLIRKIKVTDLETKKSFEYESPVDLYINPKIKISDDEDVVTVSSKTFNDYLFEYVVKNNELTKSLENIVNLIESSSHLGVTTYSGLVNMFMDLLIENDLGYINSVHNEIICSVLIRDIETGKPLNFSNDTLNSYKIIRVSKSVMSGPISKSLAFERLNDQFSDLDTYTKDDVSYFDYLYN